MLRLENICACPLKDSTFNGGLLGKKAHKTKILFVLHFFDSRAPSPHCPTKYKEALIKSQTGNFLTTKILPRIELSLDDIYLTNYVKCLTPSDREPQKKEYDACKVLFQKQVADFQPKKIVLFGRPVYEHLFGVDDFHEKKYLINHFLGIPTLTSYHPGYLCRLPIPVREPFLSEIDAFLLK